MARPTPTEQIEVLLVENAPEQQRLLVAALTEGGFAMVGTVSTGQAAVAATERLRPHIVVMNTQLPGLSGYEATRQIMQRCPTPVVLISSARDGAVQGPAEALAVGAVAVARAPVGPLHPDHGRERDALCTTVRLMARVPVVTRFARGAKWPGAALPALPRQGDTPPGAPQPDAPPLILAIAASTGGPQTLQRVLRELGADFPLPVMVVQHIAADFTAPLAEWLGRVIPLQVRIAQHNEELLPGRVYLAAEGVHLMASSNGRIILCAPDPGERFCPSANRMFASVATTYGRRAIGVILTGMGDDGAQGLRALRAAGGYTLAQDAASCVVPSMPEAAVRNGAVERVVPLAQLADSVRAQVAGRARVGR